MLRTSASAGCLRASQWMPVLFCQGSSNGRFTAEFAWSAGHLGMMSGWLDRHAGCFAGAEGPLWLRFGWGRRAELVIATLRQWRCYELVSEWSNVGDWDRWSRSCLWGAVSTIHTFQPLSIFMSTWSRIGRQAFYTCHHPLHRRFFGSTRGLEAWCWGMNAICVSSTGNEELVLEVPSSWGILSSPAWQVPNFLNIWKVAWTDLWGKVYLDGVLSLVDSYNMLSYLGKRKAPDWSYHTGNLRW